jgi:hypothetical protein
LTVGVTILPGGQPSGDGFEEVGRQLYGRNGSPRLGDEGFPELVLAPAVRDGYITHAEPEELHRVHKAVAGEGR